MSNSGMNSLLGMPMRICAGWRHLHLEVLPKIPPKLEEILKILEDQEAGAAEGLPGSEFGKVSVGSPWMWFHPWRQFSVNHHKHSIFISCHSHSLPFSITRFLFPQQTFPHPHCHPSFPPVQERWGPGLFRGRFLDQLLVYWESITLQVPVFLGRFWWQQYFGVQDFWEEQPLVALLALLVIFNIQFTKAMTIYPDFY